MSDSLRDRIAVALYRHAAESVPTRIPWLLWEDTFPEVRKVWLAMADAVIAELELHPEVRINDDRPILMRLDGKLLSDHRHMSRWVTPWLPKEGEADDE